MAFRRARAGRDRRVDSEKEISSAVAASPTVPEAPPFSPVSSTRKGIPVPCSLADSRRLTALLVVALVLQGTGAETGLVLNEVLYDPEGADEGLEFVELWNTDSIPVPLEGITLESGDGSRPGLWTTLYT